MPNAMVVDLSHHNAATNFQDARQAGVVGVIHKATQGAGFVDRKYASRMPQAKAAGLLWGAYHFGTGDDVELQLHHFLSTVQPDAKTLVALDLEVNGTAPSNTMSLSQARTFLRGIEASLGRKAVLYTGSYLKDELGSASDAYFGSHRLWWAQYADAPTIQASWKDYWLWQHTDGFHGSPPKQIAGIGPCDCETYQQSAEQLAKSWA